MKKKLLISAVIIGILGGVGVYASGYAARYLMAQFIHQSGFPEARVSDISLTPDGLMIGSVSLDANDFSTVQGILVSFDWADIIQSRKIKTLSIKDISLTAEIDSAGQLKIAGWDATFPKSNSQSVLLPLQSLLLQGITINLDTPQGDIRIEAKLAVTQKTPTEQSLQYAIWGQQHQLSFDTKGTGILSANGDYSFSTTLNEGKLNLDEVEISRASGWIDIQKNTHLIVPVYKGQLNAGKINTKMNTEDILLQNVTLTLDTSKPESLFFKTSPAGYNHITLTGRWITSPENQIQINVASQKSLDIIELLYPDKVPEFKSWMKDADPLRLDLNFNLDFPLSQFKDHLKSTSFSLNLGTEKSHKKLQSTGYIINHPPSATTEIRFDKTVLGFAGGKIDVSPFIVNPKNIGSPPISVSLAIQSIDMSELAKLSDTKGLVAKGQLSGTLPLTYSAQGIKLGKGSLKSDSEGTFAYTPEQFPPSLQGDDDRMKIVREALSDFKFSMLSVDVAGDFNDKMTTTLKAEGINPALGDRPIHLNLNLDGDLGGVIKQALQAGDIGDKIRSDIMHKEK